MVANASDLARPENRSERGFSRLVEVYLGIRATNGQRLLYENYERSSTISASSRRQWLALLPALAGALLVLYLVQVPLAYSLGRRLRARQREREQLLRSAIEASDLERRRIAAELHTAQSSASPGYRSRSPLPPPGHQNLRTEPVRGLTSLAPPRRREKRSASCVRCSWTYTRRRSSAQASARRSPISSHR